MWDGVDEVSAVVITRNARPSGRDRCASLPSLRVSCGGDADAFLFISPFHALSGLPSSPVSRSPLSFRLVLASLAQFGLIDESEFERKKKKSQWAGRYSERNQESTMVGAPLAEGEEGDNYEPSPVVDEEEARRRQKASLWKRGEEEYYGESPGERARRRDRSDGARRGTGCHANGTSGQEVSRTDEGRDDSRRTRRRRIGRWSGEPVAFREVRRVRSDDRTLPARRDDARDTPHAQPEMSVGRTRYERRRGHASDVIEAVIFAQISRSNGIAGIMPRGNGRSVISYASETLRMTRRGSAIAGRDPERDVFAGSCFRAVEAPQVDGGMMAVHVQGDLGI